MDQNIKALTSRTVFWFKARMIKADAPKTRARFIYGGKICQFDQHYLVILCLSHHFEYLIDHRGSKRLLVAVTGNCAFLHLDRYHSNPGVQILSITAFTAGFNSFVFNLQREKKRMTLMLKTLDTICPTTLHKIIIFKSIFNQK